MTTPLSHDAARTTLAWSSRTAAAPRDAPERGAVRHAFVEVGHRPEPNKSASAKLRRRRSKMLRRDVRATRVPLDPTKPGLAACARADAGAQQLQRIAVVEERVPWL